MKDFITWIELFDLNKVDYQESKIKDIPVLIMAGGLGTRLLPFTNIIPKPLMPYKNKSIIEIVIDQFKYYSVKNIYISINFKANLIKAYLDQAVNKNENISLIKENQKLGTCGPLK